MTAVLAKLVLVLAASLLSHVPHSNLLMVQETFALLGRALRSAGRSRPRVSNVCSFLARKLTRYKRSGSALVCMQHFLESPLGDGDTVRQAVDRQEM